MNLKRNMPTTLDSRQVAKGLFDLGQVDDFAFREKRLRFYLVFIYLSLFKATYKSRRYASN